MVLWKEGPGNNSGGGEYQGPHLEVWQQHVGALGEPEDLEEVQLTMGCRTLIVIPHEVLVRVLLVES